MTSTWEIYEACVRRNCTWFNLLTRPKALHWIVKTYLKYSYNSKALLRPYQTQQKQFHAFPVGFVNALHWVTCFIMACLHGSRHGSLVTGTQPPPVSIDICPDYRIMIEYSWHFHTFVNNKEIPYHYSINTLRPRQHGGHFVHIFKRIFLKETVRISIKISMKCVPKGPMNSTQHWFK